MENKLVTSLRFDQEELELLAEACFRIQAVPQHAELSKKLQRRLEIAIKVMEKTQEDLATEELRKEEARNHFNRGKNATIRL